MTVDFGKVAVLMGGYSAEREISLKSGQAALAALLRLGVEAEPIDVVKDTAVKLIEQRFDRAFIALHGRGGEDGKIQGLLDSLGIPYTGSDLTGSALSMNKALTKQLWQQQQLPTAHFVIVDANTSQEQLIGDIGLPLILKPVNEGSSLGMTKVCEVAELKAAIDLALQYDDQVIAERWIDGEEYTVAILEDQVLPIIQLKTPHDFYDFEAKYQANTTQYLSKTDLTSAQQDECQTLALAAFKALRMSGWGRVDMMRSAQGAFYLLEANSIPGLTDHSLVPMAAKQVDIEFDQLIMRILATSFLREART